MDNKEIEELTGGFIKTYTFNNGKDVLKESFVSENGIYIGDKTRALWYVKNNLIVTNILPNGCALRLNTDNAKIIKDVVSNYKNGKLKIIDNEYILGYHGYTHRGGQTFKIGDKLFEEKYEPKEEYYTKEEWKGFIKSREKCIARDLKDGWCATRKKAEEETSIKDVIRFNKRGSITIETLEQAEQAAINISNYLS